MEEEIPEIFDRSFKLLMMSTNETVIASINALFGMKHPLNSAVSYPNTEYIAPNLDKRQADMLIVIEDNKYLIECQTHNDETIAIRMFRYGLAEGERSKSVEDGIMTVCFPQTMLIYLESTQAARDTLMLDLRFPDGGSYRYTCPVFKVLEHRAEELERQGLIILLPFYLLKLRRPLETTVNDEKRKSLIAEVKKLRNDLHETINRTAGAGLINGKDAETIRKILDYIYKQVYNKYREVQEGEMADGQTVYNAETFNVFESLVMQRKEWELKARENERQRQESERQRQELEKKLQESERQRQELEQKLQQKGML
ncbi:MAG: hypothetical protein LBQ88_12330 [Treponema sp.]|jgi:hypothetical protein|nr:hypothetical protein [Treponema sp.]